MISPLPGPGSPPPCFGGTAASSKFAGIPSSPPPEACKDLPEYANPLSEIGVETFNEEVRRQARIYQQTRVGLAR
jgi:hypothetical protein